MASFKPAGYYSLELPQPVETEIVDLDISELACLNQTISAFLEEVIELHEPEFSCCVVSVGTDAFINNLQPDQLINLQRWILEILSSLYAEQA